MNKTKEEQIKSYWIRINNIEERIGELSNKGVNYSKEMNKRKSLLNNVKKLEKRRKNEKQRTRT